jgi:beta-fructofuranosidase/levanase
MNKHQAGLVAFAALAMAAGQTRAQTYSEMYRPQFHFTPAMNWMNDPNGLVYADGQFNLFFQYNPSGNNWGNISWGHAAGPDLLHWTQLPVAIPVTTNANGQQTQLIFSGSAVYDVNNTSGLGTPGHPPLVALYADNFPNDVVMPDGRFIQAGTQAQSLAYSLDHGVTWTQFAGNPVIPLPPTPYQTQFMNFRDPKVFWYAPQNKWVMIVSLATIQKVVLYSSPNLRNWTPMSSFGPANAIGGNWECPDLFQLPVDGDPSNAKWVMMVGVNPGAVGGGSGTQYFLGQFDGTRFTADPGTIMSNNPPPGSLPITDFEAASYTALGWVATGGLAGTAPTTGALAGQSSVTGFHGTFFADTFEQGDSTQGTLTSPPFVISKPYINLLVGGGYHPYNPATYGTPADTETAVNLVINGQVVQTATGTNGEHLDWKSWNVTGYQGATARIQIVDANSNGWGHVNVDDIVQSDTPNYQANWVDWGPDFYAANTWNGLPAPRRVGIAWMNNWNYGGNIPTSPWRSAMSIPREYGLATINGKVQLVQAPLLNLPNLLWGSPLYISSGAQTIMPGAWTAPVGGATGGTLDISAVFDPETAKQFGFNVRTGTNGENTVVGYDSTTQQLYIDRFQSGQTGFDPSFAGRYTAPLTVDATHSIRMRILIDESSVEVFGGAGQAVLTAQIFPAPGSTGLSVFASGGYAKLSYVGIRPVNSIWH